MTSKGSDTSMADETIPIEVENRLLRRLAYPGASVPVEIRPLLLSRLLASPAAILMGAIAGLIVSGASFVRNGATVFLVLAIMEGVVFVARIVTILHFEYNRRPGKVPRADYAILMSCIWCALQGAVAFFAMRTGDTVLMVLSATMVMALIGPLCARNFAAPRLAILLVCLCLFPFIAGAISTGNPWYLILVAMAPFFLIGSMQIVSSYKSAMVRALTAERINLERSHRDPLTELQNRDGLHARIENLPPGSRLAFLAMDIDDFKEINDRYGHAMGDEVLRMVAKRIKDVAAPQDILARLGGDEFIVALPGCPPPRVKTVAQRYLRAISDRHYRFADLPPLWVGVSIGYACLPEDARTIPILHEYADRALYAAKRTGKGRSLRFGGDRET